MTRRVDRGIVADAVAPPPRSDGSSGRRINGRGRWRCSSDIDLEADVTPALDDVAPTDFPTKAVHFLIDNRLELADFATRNTQDEVAARVHAEVVRTLEMESNILRVCARRDVKIVFQLPLVAVVDEVDAGIDRLVPNRPITRNVRTPLAGVATN